MDTPAERARASVNGRGARIKMYGHAVLTLTFTVEEMDAVKDMLRWRVRVSSTEACGTKSKMHAISKHASEHARTSLKSHERPR